MFQPWLTAELQTLVMALACGILPLCHVVLPLVGGIDLSRLGGLVYAKCLLG